MEEIITNDQSKLRVGEELRRNLLKKVRVSGKSFSMIVNI